MSNDTDERIKNVMSGVFGISMEKIQDDSSIETIKSWSSLKHINLVLSLEEEFDIEFNADEITEIISYKLIVSSVKSKKL